MKKEKEKMGSVKTCPVCEMNVKEEEAEGKMTHNQKEYFFCCDECMKEFKKNPNKYAAKA